MRGVKKMPLFNSDEELEALFQKYQPVVLSLQAQYYVRDMLEDDWIQEGRIIFYKCWTAYDEAFGSTFGSFYKQALQNHIFSLLRKQKAVKRQAEVNASSYESLTQTYGAEFFDAALGCEMDDPISRLIVKDVLSEYPTFCAPMERRVLNLFLQGNEIAEIAEIMHVHPQSVGSAFHRALRKIRQEIL